MIKSTLKLLILLLLLVSSRSFAGYIATDLTDDTYITYGGYDWTWAAPVSVTNLSGIDPTTNEWVDNVFEDPSVHIGWMAIVSPELKLLFDELTLTDFKRPNGEIIQSVAYWNSHFVHVDEGNFDIRVGVKGPDGYLDEVSDTFYVRSSVVNVRIVVPEPATLLVFSVGLFAFACRKRINK